MSGNGFPERTLDDIMADYDEQRDEWQTLLSVQDGFVKMFADYNGKKFFCKQITDYVVDEKIEKLLTGKTVKEQMGFYYVTESRRMYATAYGDITKENLSEKAVKLSEYEGIVELLLKEKILVGAVIKGYYGEENLLLGRSVCTYCASDNEGSGTKEREDYAYLIFHAE